MNRNNRNYQYSIRKTTLGVGSVVVGVLLAGMLQAPTVLANTPSESTGNTTVNSSPEGTSAGEATSLDNGVEDTSESRGGGGKSSLFQMK